MPPYVLVAIFAAAAIASNALISKTILRFRVCSAGLVGWLSALSSGIWALILAVIFRKPFPLEDWPLMGCLAFFSVLAIFLLHRAFQEADVSTVVPVMGIKITVTSILAFLFLGEKHSPMVYLAVVLASLAVALFNLGKQQKSQGGHGHAPIVGLAYAVGASCSYAISDQFAKTAMDQSEPFTVVLWLWILTGIFCAFMALQKTYRQYQIKPRDILLFAANGGVTLAAIGALFFSFDMANGVTVPNIIFGTRGFFALAGGAILGRYLPQPLEKQSKKVYILRILATALIFGSVLISVIFN